MNKLIFLLAALLATFLLKSGFSQIDLNQTVPLEAELRTGVLDNGLTYYIRHNQEPKDRASFYIIQNVGALLEEDHQNGLAHFLEHMAFNGTGNFEGKGILNTLERHGVAFGRNINAYTAFNETVYNLSDVPVAPAGLIDTCLLILHDWANNLLLTEEEIDLERGVILEEWRTRRTSGVRLQEQWLPVVLQGSKWAERDIIGDTAVINNHAPETMRQFYHDWYRTDLQAIAIVGDFDVDEIEKKVIELFSTIEAVENPIERPVFTIPNRTETAYVLATDPEASQSQISIYILHENNDGKERTLENMRDSYITSLFNQMSGQRIQELLQRGEPPFVAGSSRYGNFVRGYNAFNIGVISIPNQQEKALRAIMTETERIKRFGFTGTELERAKLNLLTNLERRYNERDKINNDSFAREYSGNYLTKAATPGIEFQYMFAQAILPTITVDDLLEKAQKWIVTENRTIAITGPDNAEHLSENEAKSIIRQVELADIEPYTDQETAESLIEHELTGSPVVSEKELSEFDAVEWTLANGVKVVYRFADYEKDNVLLRAHSPGGSSLYDDEYMPSADMMTTFLSTYGVGDFDAIALQRMLAGKNVSISPSLGSLSEGFNGNSTPRDFETLMQLLYLFFENPRFDEEAHNALLNRYLAFVENMEKDPQKNMQDSLTFITYNYHPRVRTLNTGYLNDIEFELIEKIYNDRFHDASDFTFFIVGNIEKEVAKELSMKYLGSLTPTNRDEDWIDRGVRTVSGETKRVIPMQLSTPKTNVNIRFTKLIDYNQHNLISLRTLEGILRLRYIETIREDEGGTYGVGVGSSLSKYPISEAVMRMSFDCNPDRADYLKPIIYREIDKILENGPTADDFEKTIANLLKDREQSRRHNSFWMNSIFGYYTNGINMAAEENYENVLKEKTRDDLHRFAMMFFTDADLIDVVFVPLEN